MRHANLAVFVPHAGCPRRCSFCSQKSISGAREAPTGESVSALCAESARSLAGADTDAEIAFFGGSFTAIDRAYMLELLEAAAPFVGGAFRGIRVSTRPDAVDGEVLDLLRRYGVTAVELGAQSMDDGVLMKNRRGHTAADVERAARLVREAGFELGLQMMTGLYGSDEARDFRTAERL
ncbi:radical SAM protein, partial [uncultured Anaerotruncus sp.]|uniref:radical SAM protein n=1 Tax=uncultured Anaerotruncus sp. TaxID=905011 RepID=UPI00280A4F8D